jgi:hypothetical protein
MVHGISVIPFMVLSKLGIIVDKNMAELRGPIYSVMTKLQQLIFNTICEMHYMICGEGHFWSL